MEASLARFRVQLPIDILTNIQLSLPKLKADERVQSLELCARVQCLARDYYIAMAFETADLTVLPHFFVTQDGVSWSRLPVVDKVMEEILEESGFGLRSNESFVGRPEILLRHPYYKALDQPPTEIQRLANLITHLYQTTYFIPISAILVTSGPRITFRSSYAGMSLSEAAAPSSWATPPYASASICGDGEQYLLSNHTDEFTIEHGQDQVSVSSVYWSNAQMIYRTDSKMPRWFYDGDGLYGFKTLWA